MRHLILFTSLLLTLTACGRPQTLADPGSCPNSIRASGTPLKVETLKKGKFAASSAQFYVNASQSLGQDRSEIYSISENFGATPSAPGTLTLGCRSGYAETTFSLSIPIAREISTENNQALIYGEKFSYQ